MEKNGNEKTELKLQKKYTLSNNCNAYGPFFKQPVFLAAAFAFGCGFFLAAAFAFDCSLLRETPSSSLSPSSACALGCLTSVTPLARAAPRAERTQL